MGLGVEALETNRRLVRNSFPQRGNSAFPIATTKIAFPLLLHTYNPYYPHDHDFLSRNQEFRSPICWPPAGNRPKLLATVMSQMVAEATIDLREVALSNPHIISAACDAKRRVDSHRGTAVVEFALVLPLLFLIVFGAIQACNAIFSKQFITEVSYQGTMTASKPNTAKSAVLAEMNQLLVARGITTATCNVVGVSGTDYDLLPSGQMFKVTVTVPPTTNQSGPSVASYTTLQAESFGRKQ